MKDKKLTDSEITKALEICGTYKGKCTDCPAFVKVDRSNYKQVLLGAIEIINRLQAENKSQSIMIKMLNGSIEDYKKSYINQKAEIERLKAEVKFSDYLEYEAINQIKAEAYKEFAEQLDAEIESSDKYIREYDDSEVQKAYNKGLRDALKVLKELVGEDK